MCRIRRTVCFIFRKRDLYQNICFSAGLIDTPHFSWVWLLAGYWWPDLPGLGVTDKRRFSPPLWDVTAPRTRLMEAPIHRVMALILCALSIHFQCVSPKTFMLIVVVSQPPYSAKYFPRKGTSLCPSSSLRKIEGWWEKGKWTSRPLLVWQKDCPVHFLACRLLVLMKYWKSPMQCTG